MAASSNTASNNVTFAHVQSHVQQLIEHSPIYAHLFSKIRLHSAEAGRVVALLPLEEIHLNSKNSLHGSVSATLVDFIGGVAIASYDLRDKTGVSTDMHISFIGGARAGVTLEVEGIVTKCGGTLAFTEAKIRKYEEEKGIGQGALVSAGSHTKFVRTL